MLEKDIIRVIRVYSVSRNVALKKQANCLYEIEFLEL